ncbi:MAG TPA: hypothetical protein VK053_25470 [Jiangellaceae bacterium]|nr:hypothetical protein [Jiangellaceae bacterium]
MGRLHNVLVTAFYAGFALLLGLILTDTLRDIIPKGIAVRIGYNSEAYLFILVLAAWIQYVRPALVAGSDRRRWGWTLAAAALCAMVSIWLITVDPNEVPYRIKTLNETTVALTLILPYVTLRRPLPRAVLAAVPVLVAMTVWGVVTSPDGLIVDLAESFGFWILAVLAFDLIDRGILDPGSTTNARVRWVWYAVLAAEPIVVSAVGTEARAGGGIVAETLFWLGRVHESFIGIVVVSVYFAVIHGRTGRTENSRTSASVPSGAAAGRAL